MHEGESSLTHTHTHTHTCSTHIHPLAHTPSSFLSPPLTCPLLSTLSTMPESWIESRNVATSTRDGLGAAVPAWSTSCCCCSCASLSSLYRRCRQRTKSAVFTRHVASLLPSSNRSSFPALIPSSYHRFFCFVFAKRKQCKQQI